MTKCVCFLPTEPPDDGAEWWQPELDFDPGLRVKAVVQVGEDPRLRRAVRLVGGQGWTEEGAMVAFYQDRTPPIPWERVGTCWNGSFHPVVACEPWPL